MSTPPHVIRLRGPWDYRPLKPGESATDNTAIEGSATAPPPAGRISMPASWNQTMGDHFRGCLLCTRRFNCPTGLTGEHRVELVVADLNSFGRVALNGTRLGVIAPGDSPARYDVTALLRPRNELALEIEAPGLVRAGRASSQTSAAAAPDSVVGEVRLEIFADHARFE